MTLFRFLASDNTAHLGIQDAAGGRYDATAILPDVFGSIGAWLASPDPLGAVQTVLRTGADDRHTGGAFLVSPDVKLLAPVDTSEVWASGVTYERSRTARREESEAVGGGDFYDRVYDAPRPELFFKSAGWRVVNPGEPVRVRRDSTWNVPEPEMVLVVSAAGDIVGVTAGNDVSSRSIEGENPLYLPQAKTYDGACAIGGHIELAPFATDLRARPMTLTIAQGGETVFVGETTTAQMRRSPEELVGYLCRETAFPHGVFLFTGTGIVPPDDFTLASGDVVTITVNGIAPLINPVA